MAETTARTITPTIRRPGTVRMTRPTMTRMTTEWSTRRAATIHRTMMKTTIETSPRPEATIRRTMTATEDTAVTMAPGIVESTGDMRHSGSITTGCGVRGGCREFPSRTGSMSEWNGDVLCAGE